jgi:hypothetical protein
VQKKHVIGFANLIYRQRVTLCDKVGGGSNHEGGKQWMIRGKSIWLAFTHFQSWTRGEFHVEKEVFVLRPYDAIKQDVIYCRFLTM